LEKGNDVLQQRLTLLEEYTNDLKSLLVHDYARIVDATVWGILKRYLEDFDAFAQAVIMYIER
jgi:uncharacterized protein YutE (UPF0331/DUF86 family)